MKLQNLEMKKSFTLLGRLALLFIASPLIAQTSPAEVLVSGAMRNVMKKGKLEGSIYLDTISTKTDLFGLGPVEYLAGEILIMDGRSFISRIDEQGGIHVEESYEVAAPFLVYTQVSEWKAYELPEEVRTLAELEAYIDQLVADRKQPFAFRLSGQLSSIDFHIQNLPTGEKITEPEDAHRSQVRFHRKNVSGDLLGFFSKTHHGIFTHHGTDIHVHFINAARTEMGHVDALQLDPAGGIRLYLPKK